MTKVLDLDEKLLSQATKITGVENPNALMRIVLNEFVRTRSSAISASSPEKKTNKETIAAIKDVENGKNLSPIFNSIKDAKEWLNA